ncbi:MAG: DUF2804 family protein [Treponema sp.]|uniref:DUF2804 family protein n=1 Tax=Treponema sp. TaxID=166 RepID=UPI0025F8C362|nr:DUF2804 family protein [Treponema sp.]MBQ9282850.1 DUF2804 family protein [Treponema sp.]
MYTREIKTPPEKIIHNGKIEFGTFKGLLKRLDIRGVRTPFAGFPFPTFITNFRIQSSLMFMFNIGSYIGTVDFFDHKVFGFADVVFWNKETGRRFAYRSFMGPRRRFIPHNMEIGFCASFNKKRYIRVGWDHHRDRLSMIFNLKGDSSRPSAQAAFVSHYSSPSMCEMASVLPFPSKRRCSATYIATPQIHGTISLDKTKRSEEVSQEDLDGSALLSINRAYYNLSSVSEFVAATGELDGKKFTFQIFTTQENAVDSDNINSNILCVNGECTPLPPVTITHPFGLSKKWVIQDFENMVDLTFTPTSDNRRDVSFLVMKSQLRTFFGTFEGVIKTKDGEDIILHNFEGIAKNQLLKL